MIVNARMYSATPRAKQAWKALFREVLERARLDWEVMDYDPPAPLPALWAREDLGCTMMCGLPYSQRAPRPTLVAAPIPSPARYGGRPVYFTDFAVRADAPYPRLEDTFGGVAGFTLPDSMSGYVAPRRHLALHGRNLYKDVVTGFLNARQVIEALDELATRRGRMNPRLSHEWLRYLVSVGARHDADGWRWKIDPSLRMGGFGPWRPEWSLHRLPDIAVPFLVVLGSEPEPMGWATEPDDLAPNLPPEGRLEVFEDAGHFVHIEQPRQVADLALDFLGAPA